jgi:hypothetical protein
MLEGMKTLLVILLIAYGQAGLAQGREGVQAFVGCYALRVERHQYVFANYGREFLPKQFELKAEHVYGGFAVKNLDSNMRWGLPLSSWRFKDEGDIEITFSTGYVGWTIQMNKSGSEFRGSARFFTDTDSTLSKRDPLGSVAHKLRCEETRASEGDIRVESNGRISGTLEHPSPESDWALLKVIVLSYPNPDVHQPERETTLEPDPSTFQIGPLPAGHYILGSYGVRKVGSPDRYTFANWGWAYFPGVYDPKLAQAIEVVEGKSVSNVKLKMMY